MDSKLESDLAYEIKCRDQLVAILDGGLSDIPGAAALRRQIENANSRIRDMEDFRWQ